MSSLPREGLQDQPPVDVPLLKGLLQGLEEFLGERRVTAFLSQARNEGLLGGHTPLALDNVPFRLVKVLAFHGWVGHRFGVSLKSGG